MNKPDEFKWIKLILINEAGNYHFNYEDGLGNKEEGPYEPGPLNVVLEENSFVRPIRSSEKMSGHIKSVNNAEPRQHNTGKGFKTIPLAVYLDVISDKLSPDEILAIEVIVKKYLRQLLDGPANFQLVYYQNQTSSITPFNLPFNARIVGDNISSLSAQLTEAYWYKDNIAVNDFGLNIRAYDEILDFNSETDIDILICDLFEFARLIENRSPLNAARLYIIVYDHQRYGQPPLLPYWFLNFMHDQAKTLNCTYLYVDVDDIKTAGSFFKEFMYNLIHDFPLHEALNQALHKTEGKNLSVVLSASPQSNQSLRMSDALESFKTQIHDYSKSMNPGNPGVFLSKFKEVNPSIFNQVQATISVGSHIHNYFNHARTFDLNFHGESTGLVPMSDAKNEFHNNMEQQFKELHVNMKSLVNQKEVFDAIRDIQERKVDITLDQLSEYLVYAPMNKHTSLRPGAQYRLNVSIGQPSPYSLVEGDVPSIDPLLPDPDNEKGHLLDIVVYPKDFTLMSPTVQSVYLPALGGTDIIYFIVKAPADTQLASMRVAVFHKNNLLQAFILTAEVKEGRWLEEDPALKVVLDLATSKKFTNLDKLKPRSLYIGVNENSNRSHSLFLKKEAMAKEISGLNETLIADTQKKLSELLKSTYFQNNYQQYLATAKPGDPIPEIFYSAVRKFAKFGSSCYSHIFLSNDTDLQKQLREFIKSSDDDITIGRHEINFSYPWPLMYDYDISEPAYGMPDHPVCLGKKLDVAAHKDSVCKEGEGCPHNPGLYTYCIEGFWGVRHRIEQLITNKKPEDTKVSIQLNSGTGISFCNNVIDNYADELNKTLEGDFKAQKIKSDADLVELLWDVKSRPAALVVFGHMQTTPETGEPNHPRIITFPKAEWQGNAIIPKEKWIYHELLFNKIKNKDSWQGDPLPVVFLINCSNAGMTVESLNSIVQDFYVAGATAVIGTECDITTDLGARFVKEVLDGLYNKDLELGEAIRQFNKNLFASGIPLAFVFTCFGNNNLKIIK